MARNTELKSCVSVPRHGTATACRTHKGPMDNACTLYISKLGSKRCRLKNKQKVVPQNFKNNSLNSRKNNNNKLRKNNTKLRKKNNNRKNKKPQGGPAPASLVAPTATYASAAHAATVPPNPEVEIDRRRWYK